MLYLKDAHNAFWRETLNAKRNSAHKQPCGVFLSTNKIYFYIQCYSTKTHCAYILEVYWKCCLPFLPYKIFAVLVLKLFKSLVLYMFTSLQFTPCLHYSHLQIINMFWNNSGVCMHRCMCIFVHLHEQNSDPHCSKKSAPLKIRNCMIPLSQD